MAKEKKEKEKKDKKPAHEILVHEINSWFTSTSTGEKNASVCIQALGTALNSMIIPNEKISETEKKLTDILVNTPHEVTNDFCVEALQEVIKDFRKEHSK